MKQSSILTAMVGILGLSALSATTGVAQSLQWNIDRIKDNGKGCNFKSRPGVPQDSYAITNGNEVSFLFQNLKLDVSRTNQQVTCGFVLPVTVPARMYITSITQQVIFGMTKSRGVEAVIYTVGKINIQGQIPTPMDMVRGGPLTVAGGIGFSANEEILTAQDAFELKQSTGVHFPGAGNRDTEAEALYKRFCDPEGDGGSPFPLPRNVYFGATIGMRLAQQDPHGSASVFVDGTDVFGDIAVLPGTKAIQKISATFSPCSATNPYANSDSSGNSGWFSRR